MLGLLKNVLLTAVMVVCATMVTAGVAAVVTLLVASRETTALDGNLLFYGGAALMMMAVVVGFFFSIVSLFVAALTMPPAIGLMRMLKLPRPLFDVLGGGAAGLLCAAAAAGSLESMARAKGGDLGGDEMRLVLDLCAMLAGGFVGFLRRAVLVRQRPAPAEPQLAY